MAYWVDDGFDTWPETIRAGSAAAGLYIRCGSWIARNTHDGHIPAEVATMYGTPEWIRKLLDVGLWEAEGTGYRDVRYFQMGNPTAETVTQRKAQKAERQQRWLEKTRQRRVSRRSQDPTVDASKDDAPALPPPPTGEGRGARAREAGTGRAAPVDNRGSAPTCPTCGNRTNSSYCRRVCARTPTEVDP